MGRFAVVNRNAGRVVKVHNDLDTALFHSIYLKTEVKGEKFSVEPFCHSKEDEEALLRAVAKAFGKIE